MAKPNQIDAAPPQPGSALPFISSPGYRVQDALFFGLLFWFLWRWVDPRLLYHGGGEIQVFPTFRWGRDCFHDFWPYQGGLARYAAAFLAQSLFHGWAGALVLTLQAWLVSACTRSFLRSLGADHLRWASFVPSLLLLALHSGYTYCFGTVTSLLLGLGLVVLWIRSPLANPWLRLSVIGMLAGALYAVAGSALGVFVLLAALFELHQGRWPLALLSIPLAVLLPLAEGRILFGLNWAEALDGLRPFGWRIDTTVYREMILVYGLYLFLPVLSLGVLLWRGAAKRILLKRPPAALVKKAASMAKRPDVKSAHREVTASRLKLPVATRSHHLGLMIETACVLLAAAGTLGITLDSNLRAVLAVDYYAAHRMWPQVLAAARANPHNVYIVSAVNRALFHTGNLGRDLPLFQSADNLLLLDDDVRAHWNKIDIYLDLGCVNLALHHLAEAVALYGERPFLLTRLALANLSLGNSGTARIYLRSLERTPFYAAWANDCLRRMALDPTLSGDAEVARLRSLLPAHDELVPMPPDQMLSGLIEAHKTNRMAVEYLICYHLLTKDLQALPKDLDRLDCLESGERPNLYDEAALLASRRGPKGTNLIARLPRSETQKRFERFVALAKASKRKPLTSDPALCSEFGASYFFYYYSPP